jgi:hypothetical protein
VPIQIGAQPEDDHRIAELIPSPPLDIPWDAMPDDHPARKTFGTFPPGTEGASLAETTAWRRPDIGAAMGTAMRAHWCVARSPISLGGKANGVQLFGPAAIDLIFQEQSNGIDQVLLIPLRFGIGLGLPKPESIPAIPDERSASGAVGAARWLSRTLTAAQPSLTS